MNIYTFLWLTHETSLVLALLVLSQCLKLLVRNFKLQLSPLSLSLSLSLRLTFYFSKQAGMCQGMWVTAGSAGVPRAE